MSSPGEHDDDARLGAADHRHHHVPRGTGTFAMWLFLIALGMLFAASLIGYLIINFTMGRPHEVVRDGVLVTQVRDLPPIELPHLLWLSTIVMIASSVTVHWALVSVQRELGQLAAACGRVRARAGTESVHADQGAFRGISGGAAERG